MDPSKLPCLPKASQSKGGMSSRGGERLENPRFFPWSSSTLWVVYPKIRLFLVHAGLSVVPQDYDEDRKLGEALVKEMRS